jgi:hypothetical protein
MGVFLFCMASLDEKFNALPGAELMEDGDENPTLETIGRARRYHTLILETLSAEVRAKLGEPDITGGPDGSIDIHWKGEGYEVLLDVPADPLIPANYYADDGNYGAQVKGKLTL